MNAINSLGTINSLGQMKDNLFVGGLITGIACTAFGSVWIIRGKRETDPVIRSSILYVAYMTQAIGLVLIGLTTPGACRPLEHLINSSFGN